jgi:L-alanine-DL-glutamate epimerase-like enolase superfamily enzyme
MKIARIEAIPVSVPRAEPFASALGVQETTDFGIVRVYADDGTVGLGEISLIWHGDGAGLCGEVNRRVAPGLAGRDVFELTRLHAEIGRCLEFGRHTLTAAAAVEMAVLDIQGKALGLPVATLLGGITRDRIELSMSVPIGAPSDVAARAARYADEGFSTVKVKVGGSVEDDVATIRAIRDALGDRIRIRTDANMSFATAKEALRAIRRFEELDVISVEQPLAPGDVAGMAFLRERCEIPVIADESVWSPEDAWEIVRHGAADILNVYVSEAGGIWPARRIADLTALAGVGFCIGSMPELGIGWAAAAQLGFAVPRLDHPADVAGVLYQRETLIEQSADIREGWLHPLPGPGLGVTLDDERIEAFRTDRRGVA